MSPASQSSALTEDFGWGLRAVSMTFQALAGDAVADLPGRARGYLVLVAVSRAEAPSQLSLATQLGIDKNQMTAVIDALEERSLVKRTADPADRRARLIAITPRGRRRLDRARAAIREVEDHLLDALEPDARRSFRSMLSQIAAGTTDPRA